MGGVVFIIRLELFLSKVRKTIQPTSEFEFEEKCPTKNFFFQNVSLDMWNEVMITLLEKFGQKSDKKELKIRKKMYQHLGNLVPEKLSNKNVICTLDYTLEKPDVLTNMSKSFRQLLHVFDQKRRKTQFS